MSDNSEVSLEPSEPSEESMVDVDRDQRRTIANRIRKEGSLDYYNCRTVVKLSTSKIETEKSLRWRSETGVHSQEGRQLFLIRGLRSNKEKDKLKSILTSNSVLNKIFTILVVSGPDKSYAFLETRMQFNSPRGKLCKMKHRTVSKLLKSSGACGSLSVQRIWHPRGFEDLDPKITEDYVANIVGNLTTHRRAVYLSNSA